MNSIISDRVSGLERSGTSSLHARVEDLREQGHAVLRLSGISAAVPPRRVLQAAADAALSELALSPHKGMPRLRGAISDLLRQQAGYAIDEDCVLVTHGAKEAIHLALTSLCPVGSSVVIPTPSYPYGGNCALVGLNTRYVATDVEDDYCLDIAAVGHAIDASTSAILLTNPVNPTGAVLSGQDVRTLAEIAAEAGVWLITDESFGQMVYEPNMHWSAITQKASVDNIVVVSSFSKAYGLAPWRVGYMVGPPDIVDIAAKVQEWQLLRTNPVSQHGALEALTGDQEWVDDARGAAKNCRDAMVHHLGAIPDIRFAVPKAGGSVLVDISGYVVDDVAFSEQLLVEHAVPCVAGRVFGAEATVRLPFVGSMVDISEAARRFEDCLLSFNHR